MSCNQLHFLKIILMCRRLTTHDSRLTTRLLILAALFSLVTSAAYSQAYDMRDVENYIEQYKETAITEMNRTGIPASITLAQGIIESGAGKSLLATEANNHFGIKCHTDWKGEGYHYDDDRKNECFRKYDSVLQSFHDHSDFLKYRQRYAVLFTYDPMDYKEWAKGLKACGYATNPKYAHILIQCIEDYDLHQWDLNEEDRDEWFAQINNTDSEQKVDSSSVFIQKENALEVLLQKEDPASRIYVFNDIKCVNLREGESLQQLATTYEIGMKRLMRYNDISDPAVFKPSDRIYIQPKRHNGEQKYHTVAEGETMFSIAHQHGIQLNKLYEKNKMKTGTQPAPGEEINLRDSRDEAPQTQEIASTETNQAIPELKVDQQVYTVVRGDTLYGISKKYNLSIQELKDMNGLSSDDLQVGTRLKLKPD